MDPFRFSTIEYRYLVGQMYMFVVIPTNPTDSIRSKADVDDAVPVEQTSEADTRKLK